jgi:hypothetical protein
MGEGMKKTVLGLGKVLPILSKPYPLVLENFRIPIENAALQYWKAYFDFGYFLLFVPFRFAFRPDTGNYDIQTNIVQKVSPNPFKFFSPNFQYTYICCMQVCLYALQAYMHYA